MYPASFEYFAPSTLDEALSVLERYGDEAVAERRGRLADPEETKLALAKRPKELPAHGLDST